MGNAQRHIRQLLGWLGDREHQLQLAIEAAGLGTWHWNLTSGETFWSGRCRALLGVGADAPASFDALLELVHADDRDGVLRTIEEAQRSGATCAKEFRVHRDGGTLHWLHSIGRVQRGRGPGGALVMSGVIRDVTLARTADAAAKRVRTLEARERLWSNTFVHNIHGLAVGDAATLTYLVVNPAYGRLLGYASGNLEGRSVLQCYPESEHANVRALSGRSDEIGSASGETLQQHRNGALIPVLLDLVSLRDEHGAVTHRISTITDLRERAARERTHGQVRALAHRLEQLRALERVELADTLRKEFHESLAAVKDGLADLRGSAVAAPVVNAAGECGADADALARLLGQAEAAQERLRRMIFDLQPPDIRELGFAPAIERYASELGARWGLRTDLDLPAVPPEVPGHILAVLYDVACEALANVARHARATRVALGLAISDGSIRLRVSDDGVGLGEHDRNKPGCFGLLRAGERLATLDGTLRTLGVAGGGTLVQASVPLVVR